MTQSTLSKRTLSKEDTSLRPTANLVPAELHLSLCNWTLSKVDTSLSRTVDAFFKLLVRKPLKTDTGCLRKFIPDLKIARSDDNYVSGFNKIYQFVWAVLGSVRTAKRDATGPSCDHCILYESPGFNLEVQISSNLNSLQAGHLSKEDSSFGPKGVRFRESWLYSPTNAPIWAAVLLRLFCALTLAPASNKILVVSRDPVKQAYISLSYIITVWSAGLQAWSFQHSACRSIKLILVLALRSTMMCYFCISFAYHKRNTFKHFSMGIMELHVRYSTNS